MGYCLLPGLIVVCTGTKSSATKTVKTTQLVIHLFFLNRITNSFGRGTLLIRFILAWIGTFVMVVLRYQFFDLILEYLFTQILTKSKQTL